MWQISWMLGLLPEWFWTLLLIAGIIGLLASWILKFVPFVSSYKLPIQVVSIVFLFIGVYYQGFYSNEAKWQARVKELEEKIALVEKESVKENTVVQEKIVYRDRVIKQKAEKQIVYVDRIVKGDTVEITKDMSEAERAEFKKKQEELERALKMCPVPRLIIEEHNKAAVAVKEINQAATPPKKEEDKK